MDDDNRDAAGDGTAPGTELLESVVLNVDEGGTPQYMLQRIPENTTQLLATELLHSHHHHHNGLVVDLAAGDFIPVTYPADALLSHDLTEEDRNLAAALVAVQLSQQQKQQQQQQQQQLAHEDALVVGSTLDNSKVLHEHEQQQLILGGEKDDVTTSLSNGFLQIVSSAGGSDGIYVEKQQTLPKLIDSHGFTFDERSIIVEKSSSVEDQKKTVATSDDGAENR